MSELLATPTSIEALDELISRPSQAVIESLQKCPGRIAVLGAGGKMGFHLSLMLQRALQKLNRADPVITVSRFGTAATREKFQDRGFETVAADLCDRESVASLPQVENVFFLAGVKFGTSDNPELLHQFNVAMPQLVAEHCRDSRIVALSTGCVYEFTTPESGGSTEQSPTNPVGAYAVSCKGRERAFQVAGTNYGTRSALIRLNYSIDLRYGVLVDIAQKVMAGQPVNVETGFANVIWQGDAIAHTIQSLCMADAPPFVINVTGPEILHVRDIALMFARRFNTTARIEGREAPTAWLSNAATSHRLFGTPEIPLEQMLHWIAEWLEAGGETLNKPTQFEVRHGKY